MHQKSGTCHRSTGHLIEWDLKTIGYADATHQLASFHHANATHRTILEQSIGAPHIKFQVDWRRVGDISRPRETVVEQILSINADRCKGRLAIFRALQGKGIVHDGIFICQSIEWMESVGYYHPRPLAVCIQQLAARYQTDEASGFRCSPLYRQVQLITMASRCCSLRGCSSFISIRCGTTFTPTDFDHGSRYLSIIV